MTDDLERGNAMVDAGSRLGRMLNIDLHDALSENCESPEDRLRFWAGYLGHVYGHMRGDVGFDAARAVLTFLLRIPESTIIKGADGQLPR